MWSHFGLHHIVLFESVVPLQNKLTPHESNDSPNNCCFLCPTSFSMPVGCVVASPALLVYCLGGWGYKTNNLVQMIIITSNYSWAVNGWLCLQNKPTSSAVVVMIWSFFTYIYNKRTLLCCILLPWKDWQFNWRSIAWPSRFSIH